MKVLALCYSYYHLAQTLGLCNWLHSQGVRPELSAFRGRFLGDFRIKPAAIDFSCLNYPANLADIPPSIRGAIPWAVLRLVMKSMGSGTRVALVSPNGPHIGLLSAMTVSGNPPDMFFSIEDGMGTYGTMFHRAKAKTRESRRTFAFPVYLFGELVKQLLLNITTLRSGAITEIITTRSGLGKRIQIAPYVKQALASGVFQYSGEQTPENTVLFLSQPFVEIGIIEEKHYLQVIQVVSTHFKVQGHHFLVKPHPSEKIGKFHGLSVCHFDGPVETLLGTQQDRIACVIGINSTALVLAQRLFNFPAYRVQHNALNPINGKVSDKRFNQLLQECTIPLRLD